MRGDENPLKIWEGGDASLILGQMFRNFCLAVEGKNKLEILRVSTILRLRKDDKYLTHRDVLKILLR